MPSEQYAHFKQAISYYNEVGITIAIDDVGAGYSSLEAIMEIKPRYVKIDASIIRGVHESAGKRAMLKALHTLAKSIDAETVGEGVETKEDLAVLIELGIDYAQGYYFAKPGVLSRADPALKLQRTVARRRTSLSGWSVKIPSTPQPRTRFIAIMRFTV